MNNITAALKSLRTVETMMDNIFTQAQSAQLTNTSAAMPVARSRRLKQATTSPTPEDGSANVTTTSAPSPSSLTDDAAAVLHKLMNILGQVPPPAAGLDTSSFFETFPHEESSEGEWRVIMKSSRRLRFVGDEWEEDTDTKAVAGFQYQIDDIIKALGKLTSGAVLTSDYTTRRRLMAQARGLEERMKVG